MPAFQILFRYIADLSYRYWKFLVFIVFCLIAASPFLLQGLLLETTSASMSSADDPSSRVYRRNMERFGESSPFVILLDYPDTPIQAVNNFTETLVREIRTWEDILHIEARVFDLYDLLSSSAMLRAAILNADPEILSSFTAKFSEDGMEREVRKSRKRLITLEDPALRNMVANDILNVFSLSLPYFTSRMNTSGFSFDGGYFDSAGGNSRLIFIYPVRSSEEAQYSVELLARTDELIQRLKGSIEDAGSIQTHFAGKYAVAGEGMEILRKDMILITIIASSLIFLLLLFVFRNVRALLIAFIPIMISLLIVFVFARIFFNPINFLAMSFAAIIIGIGVDVMLHLTGRFFQSMPRTSSTLDAVHTTLQDCGPPVVIGLTTTAAAFFCLVFAEYDALKQFGLLVAAGLLLTLWTCLFLFPAMVKIFVPESMEKIKPIRIGKLPSGIFSLLLTRPFLSVGVAVLFFTGSVFFLGNFSFEMDVFSAFPENLKSLGVAESISDTFGVSYLMSTQVTLEGHDFHDVLTGLESLDKKLIRLVDEQKISGFQSPSQYLVYPDREGIGPDISLYQLDRRKEHFLKLLERYKFIPDPGYERYFELMAETVDYNSISCKDWIQENGSHPLFRKYLTVEDDKLVLQTYVWPSDEKGRASAKDDLAPYLRDLPLPDGVHLSTTGTYQIFQHINTMVRNDFFRVSLISIVIVFLFALIFFKKLSLVWLCMAPLLVAIPMTLAVVTLTEMFFTPLSVGFIAMIVGIGIDDAVHILVRAKNSSVKELNTILEEVGFLLTLTTLSTMIGFGTMMISSYYTLYSTGFVIVLGVFLCLVFTFLLVPAGYLVIHRKTTGIGVSSGIS
jgi:uncharacterized protein